MGFVTRDPEERSHALMLRAPGPDPERPIGREALLCRLVGVDEHGRETAARQLGVGLCIEHAADVLLAGLRSRAVPQDRVDLGYGAHHFAALRSASTARPPRADPRVRFPFGSTP